MPTRKSAEAKTSSPSKAGPKPPTIVVGKITQALTDAALHGEEHGFMGDVRDDAAEFVANAVLNRKAGKPSITIETLPPSSGHRTMRLAVINDDMPFLVDSIATTVDATGLMIPALVRAISATVDPSRWV